MGSFARLWVGVVAACVVTPGVIAGQELADFDYERGLEVCLELLRRDYDDREAHLLILDTFHALGFKNELVLRVREELR